MQSLSILLFLFSVFYLAHSQLIIKQLVANQLTSDTADACSSKYYKLAVNAPSSVAFYYLEVNVTTTDGQILDIIVTDQPPTDPVNSQRSVYSPYSDCAVASGQTQASPEFQVTLQVFCQIRAGDWFVGVKPVSSSVSNTSYTVSAGPRPVVSPQEIMVQSDSSAPGTLITSRTPAGNQFDYNDFYFMDLSKKPLAVPGSRIKIMIVPDTEVSVTGYLNYNRIALSQTVLPASSSCGFVQVGQATGPLNLTLSSCAYAAGGKWYFTIQRDPAINSYTLSVFVEVPRVVTYASTKGTRQYLQNQDDIIYYRYDNLQLNENVTLSVVVDSVGNGNVTLGVLQNTLPFQDCSLNGQSCTASMSCNIVIHQCSKSTSSWFIGVRADVIKNSNDPLVFTIQVIITPKNITQLSTSSTIAHVVSHRNIYNYYRIPAPTAVGSWLRIYIYVDYTRELAPADVQLFIGSDHTVGDPADGVCYKSVFGPCTASSSLTTIGSCTIQLDPCQIAKLGNVIYVSVKALQSGPFSYFYNQDTVSYTLKTITGSPNVSPYLISPSTVTVYDTVAAGQYVLYSVAMTSENLEIQAAVTDQTLTTGVEVSILTRNSVLGPTCPCWNPDSRVNISNYANPVVVFESDACDSMTSQQIYLAVRGLQTSSSSFTLTERQFSLYFFRSSISNSLLFSPITLNQGPEQIFSAGQYYFKLNFNRANLLSKALKITLRTATLNVTVDANLYVFRKKIPQITCDLNSYDYSVEWHLDSDQLSPNPDQYTLTQYCIFDSDADSSYFVVRVDASSGIGANFSAPGTSGPTQPPSFAIFFDIIDKSPAMLNWGVPVSGELEQNVYQHFYFDVDKNLLTNNIAVQAYFDAGVQQGTGAIDMYVNPPSVNAPAGSPIALLPGDKSCYCNARSFSDLKKIVYTINACDLVPGRYYISLVSRQNSSSIPAQFTLTATAKPAVVAAAFDVPINDAAFVGQPIAYSVAIPATMLNSLTFTGRVLKATLESTQPTDVVSMYLSTSLPADISGNSASTCSCYSVSPGFTCDTDTTGSCKIEQQYCSIALNGGATQWYFTVLVKGSTEPKNPVGYNLFFTLGNSSIPVIPLTVTAGCSSDPGLALEVNNNQYRYFSISKTGLSITGEESVVIKVHNVEGGSAILATQSNNLPTTGCSSIGPFTCPPDTDCDFPVTCGLSSITHLAVYGISGSNSVPVKFEISVCYAQISTYALNSPVLSSETLDQGLTRVYNLTSLSQVNMSRAPIITASFSTFLSLPSQSVELIITNGVCKSCSSSVAIPGVTSQLCPSGSNNCEAHIYGCNLPANFVSQPWFVRVVNNVPASQYIQIQYDFQVTSQYITDSLTELTSGNQVSIDVPNGGWAVVSWTISSSEIAALGSNIARAQLEISGAAPSVSSVNTYIRTGSVPFPTCFDDTDKSTYMLQYCCLQPAKYFVTIRNTGSSTATVTLNPKIIPLASQVNTAWTPNSKTITVTQTDDNEALVNLVVPFPSGFPFNGSGNSLFILVNNSDSSIVSYNRLFIEQNSIAGPTAPCFSSSFQPLTVVSMDSPFSRNIYVCDKISPSNLWFGLSRNQGGVSEISSTNWTVGVYVTPEVPIKFGQLAVNAPHVDVRQPRQYVVTMPTTFQWKSRVVRFTVTSLSDSSIQFAVNNGRPAATTPKGCATSLEISRTITGEGDSDFIELPSCSFISGGLYYIGVEPKSANAPIQYSILVSTRDIINSTDLVANGANLPLAISSGTPAEYRLADSSPFLPQEYIVIAYFSASSSLPTITWTIDGDCQTRDTSFQDPDALPNPYTAQTFFPCDLQSGDYRVTITAPTDLDGFLRAQRKTGAVYNVGVNQSYLAAVSALDIIFFRIKIASTDFLPGQILTIKLTDVSCGDVEAWINEGYPAGPSCNSKKCTSAGCQFLSATKCGMDDWNDEWWVTVRPLHQANPGVPIKVSVSAVVTGNSTFRTIHTNEQLTIYASHITPPSIISNCPAPILPSLPACCDSGIPPVIPTTLTLEDVHLIYPTEGALMLDNFHTVTLSLSEFVLSAELTVSAHAPSFCRNITGVTIPLPGEFKCTATSDKPCSISLAPPKLEYCPFVDKVRQTYFWVNPKSVTWKQPGFDISMYPSGQVPVLKVTTKKTQYPITVFTYETTPKFYQFSLSYQELNLFRVDHPTTLPSNYHFKAEITYSSGRVDLSRGWQPCSFTPQCSESTCATLKPGAVSNPCKPTNNCGCSLIFYACEVTGGSSSLFAARNPNNNTLVDVTLKISFGLTEEPITPACEFVTAGSHRWYTAPSSIGASQIYRFDIQEFQDFSDIVGGGSQLKQISLVVNDGSPAFYNGPCRSPINVSSTGQKSTIFYRRNSEPHLAVYGVSGNSNIFYKLNSSLVTVPIVSLTTGQLVTSPSTAVDPVTKCLTTTTSEYFLFPTPQARTGGFLLVQLWGSSVSVFMNMDSLTYKWSPVPGHTCSTGSSGYCSFIVKCGYTPSRNYYFHVTPNTFSFSVTFMTNPTPIPFTLGQTISFPVSPDKIYSYSIAVPGTLVNGPNTQLIIETSTAPAYTAALITTWLNAGTTFTGTDCAVDSKKMDKLTPFSVSSCDLSKTTSNFLVNFHVPPSATSITCFNTTIVLTAYLVSDGIPVVAYTPALKTISSGLTRYSVSPGTIGANDVVYARISSFARGNIALSKIWKGLYTSTAAAPSLGSPVFPCSGCSTSPQFLHVAWLDSCFLCTGTEDTVFVDVTATSIVRTNYNLTVVKTSWVPLTSSWITGILQENTGIQEHAGALAFYSANINKAQGSQIDIEVRQGGSVLVQIYGSCDTATPVEYWCYQGSTCQLPFPVANNFGISGPLVGGSVRIVISGRSASFRIRQITSTAACAKIPTNYFCSGTEIRPDGLVWSEDPTMILSQKDDWAKVRYQNYVNAFSCPAAQCQCRTLSDLCLSYLKQYACIETLGTCSDQGFRLGPYAPLCMVIEQTCAMSFASVGFPELSCSHGYYYGNPSQWVNDQGIPVSPPNSPPTVTTAALTTAVPTTLTSTTGAASTGSASTGSASTGSASTGSVSTGGASTGSASTGGASTGSASTGSASTGSASTGSASTGGASTGSASTGNADSSSVSSGGASTVSSSVATTGNPQGTSGIDSTGISVTSSVVTSSQPTSSETTAVSSANDTSSSNPIDSSETSGLTGGAIAGIVIGVVVLLLLIAGGVFFALRTTAASAMNQFQPGRYESILDDELKAEGGGL